MKEQPQILRYLLPSLSDVLFVALFVAVVMLGPQLMNVDGDLGRHITIGSYILESRNIPTKDIFSHTKFGDPLTPHEWLIQIVFAFLHKLAGLDGVVWFTALVIAGTFWVVYRQSIEKTGWVVLSTAFVFLGAAASSLHWLTRPHIITFLLLAVWTGRLESMRSGEDDRWWLLPLLMLFWANAHGAFFAGFVLWAMYFLGQWLEGEISNWEGSRIWVLGLVSSLLVTVLNPAGFKLWGTSLGFLGSNYLVGHTAEYLPPDFQDISTWPFLLMILCSIVFLAYEQKRLPFTEIIVIAGWTAMGLVSARNIPLYAVLAAPILADRAKNCLQDTRFGNISVRWGDLEMGMKDLEGRLKQGVWVGIVVLGMGFALLAGLDLDLGKTGNQFSPTRFPVDAVNWIEDQGPQGKMFNYFPWGGYLLYELWPEHRVFIDGQTDFYGERLTREYECVITLCSEWEDVLDSYNVNWVIMPTASPLSESLHKKANWNRVFQGEISSIFIKEQDR